MDTQHSRLSELLKDLRNQNKLTLAELSQKTGIKDSILVQLENSDFSNLPPTPYLRAFLSTLSRYYKIQPDLLLNALNTFLNQSTAPLASAPQSISRSLEPINSETPLPIKGEKNPVAPNDPSPSALTPDSDQVSNQVSIPLQSQNPAHPDKTAPKVLSKEEASPTETTFISKSTIWIFLIVLLVTLYITLRYTTLNRPVLTTTPLQELQTTDTVDQLEDSLAYDSLLSKQWATSLAPDSAGASTPIDTSKQKQKDSSKTPTTKESSPGKTKSDTTPIVTSPSVTLTSSKTSEPKTNKIQPDTLKKDKKTQSTQLKSVKSDTGLGKNQDEKKPALAPPIKTSKITAVDSNALKNVGAKSSTPVNKVAPDSSKKKPTVQNLPLNSTPKKDSLVSKKDTANYFTIAFLPSEDLWIHAHRPGGSDAGRVVKAAELWKVRHNDTVTIKVGETKKVQVTVLGKSYFPKGGKFKIFKQSLIEVKE